MTLVLYISYAYIPVQILHNLLFNPLRLIQWNNPADIEHIYI